MKFEIKHRFGETILFTAELSAEIEGEKINIGTGNPFVTVDSMMFLYNRETSFRQLVGKTECEQYHQPC